MAAFNLVPKYLTLSGGVQLYTERVTAKGAATSTTPSTTIVFLHGIGGTTSMAYPLFADLLSAFPTAELVAYDFSGTGNSSPPASTTGMSWPNAIKNLSDFLDEEVPKGNIVLVGHSASTFLISQYLLSSPATIPRITHAVLIGGPMRTPLPKQQVDFLTATVTSIKEKGPAAVIDNVLSIWTGKTAVEKRPLATALTRALFVAQDRDRLGDLFGDFVNTVATTSLDYSKYPRSVKTLVIFGLEDEVIALDVIDAVVAGIPGGKIAKVPNVGQ